MGGVAGPFGAVFLLSASLFHRLHVLGHNAVVAHAPQYTLPHPCFPYLLLPSSVHQTHPHYPFPSRPLATSGLVTSASLRAPPATPSKLGLNHAGTLASLVSERLRAHATVTPLQLMHSLLKLPSPTFGFVVHAFQVQRQLSISSSSLSFSVTRVQLGDSV